MIDRHALIESFKDTCQRFKDNSVLRDATLATYSGVIGPASRKNKATVTEF